MSEIDSPPSERPDPWSQLWGQTVRSSWDLFGDDPIAAALREHWQVQGTWIRDRSQVVDVGSGPAVLARLLQPSAPDPERKTQTPLWTCVDQARVPEASLSGLPGVAGKFGLPWEALPAPSAAADALVSNFGLEYVSRDQLARTCASWVAQGGRLHAVLHASDSLIDTHSAMGLGDLDLILDELDFPGRLGAVLTAKVTAPADPLDRMMHGTEVRDAFNECVNRMKARLELRGTREGALLEWLVLSRDLVQSVSEASLGTALERLQAQRTAYDAERSRLSAMRASALDQPAVEALGRELALHGFESIQLGRLEASVGPVAWVLDASKSQGAH